MLDEAGKQIEAVASRFDLLISNLSRTNRRKMLRRIANNLARTNKARITKQQNLDGSQYEPKKTKPKPKNPHTIKNDKGRIRRKKLFVKLKTTKFMKKKVWADGLTLGYDGKSGTIARTHQYGLEDWMGRGKRRRKIKLPKRELLGMTDEDLKMVELEIASGLGE